MNTEENVANATAPLPGAGQLELTPAPTAPAAFTTMPTTPAAGGAHPSFAGSGSAIDPDGGSATITPNSLTSGVGGSGSFSGMNFIASPQQSGSGASVSGPSGGNSGFDPIAGSNGALNFGSGGAASSGDFTPPTAPGSSSWNQYGGSDTGPGAWPTAYNDQPVVPAHDLIVLS
jgi:hypothetical protein